MKAPGQPMPLSRAITDVPRPTYDRRGLSVGILHIGVGGFHRAHQAVAIDRLLELGLAHDWAICGVGLLPSDRAMQRVLTGSDGLYTLVEKHPDGTRRPRVIGSILEYLLAPDDPQAVLERLTDPGVRIVSMTITEGAYPIDPLSGTFDPAAAGVEADLRPGAVPSTAFGYLVEALRRRRDRGVPPFSVMSCDNMRGNGAITHRVLTGFARSFDPELAEWIAATVCCPSSMVDRITPTTTEADRIDLAQQFGISDRWPVVCEPYFQWVLENHFSAGRPPLDAAGVQLVDDVEPYELMKLRLLNAGHQVIAYFGLLCGHTYVHEAAQDPALRALLVAYLHTEAIPTLRPVPGIDLDRYCQTLLERFANPWVADTLARLVARAVDRLPTFLLPVIVDNLACARPVRVSAAVLAAWAQHVGGSGDDAQPLPPGGGLADQVRAARAVQEDPVAFAKMCDLLDELGRAPRFAAAYRDAADSLRTSGPAHTIAALLR